MLLFLEDPKGDSVIVNTDDISRITTAALRSFSKIYFKSGGEEVIVEATPDEIKEMITSGDKETEDYINNLHEEIRATNERMNNNYAECEKTGKSIDQMLEECQQRLNAFLEWESEE